MFKDKLIEFMKKEEGVILHKYLCPAGRWTLGTGHLLSQQELNSGKVIINGESIDYTNGITIKQNDDLLIQDLNRFINIIEKNVRVILNDNQKVALVSFIYNIGIGAFLGSTALRRLNQSDYEGCAEALGWWKYATVNGEKKPILEGRRKREIDLFNKK